MQLPSARRFHQCMAVVVCGTLLGCQTQSEGPAPQQPEALATSAPSGSLTDAPSDVTESAEDPPLAISVTVVDRAGYETVLERYRGKVVLIDFWATWCAPCRSQFPHTVALSHKFEDRALAVISVSMDDVDDKTEVARFLKGVGASFDNLLSSYGVGLTGFEAFELGDEGIPHYKLIDRNGEIRLTTSDPEVLEAQIEALLNE